MSKELPQEYMPESLKEILAKGRPIWQAVKETIEAKDEEIAAQNEQIEKLKGLLKEMHNNVMRVNKPLYELVAKEQERTFEQFVEYTWQSYCKEHNITP